MDRHGFRTTLKETHDAEEQVSDCSSAANEFKAFLEQPVRQPIRHDSAQRQQGVPRKPKEGTDSMTTDNHESEKQAIRDAIMATYHEGHIRNDPEAFLQILHPEWRFFRIDAEGKLCIQDRDAYVAQYDPAHAGPPLDWETEIYSIDITGDFASVKLRIECSLVKCIDYFNMMKLDGRWWIVHEISHGELKQANR